MAAGMHDAGDFRHIRNTRRLDDWQGVARASADWSALAARAEISYFEDALPDEDAAAARLADFDIVMSMRERTPFPASLIARLPKLRMLSVTGARNKSVDLKALADTGRVTKRGEGKETTWVIAEKPPLDKLELYDAVCVRVGRELLGFLQPLGLHTLHRLDADDKLRPADRATLQRTP